MGGVAVFGRVFILQAEQATIPAYALYPNAVGGSEVSSLKGASFVGEPSPMTSVGAKDDFTGFMVLEKGSAIDSPTVSDGVERKNGSLVYKVAKGDVISIVARKFAVSVDAIISANNLKKSGVIRLGQELIIPNPKTVKVVPVDSTLLDVKAYLSMPVKDGLNLGELRGNSVDILASCGAPIYASAEGIVEEVGDPSGWNDGNGGYVIVKHQFKNNDVETVYANNSKNLVEVGDLVGARDKIAEVGNTGGDPNGPTGCHVSFGVVGAKNPFSK